MGFGYRLRQAEVDNLRRSSASPLRADHNVARFDIPMDEILFVHRGQTGSDLCCDFQRRLCLKPAGAPDKILQSFPFHKFHRIEVIPTASTQVEDRGNIGMTDAGCRAGFAQKTKTRRLVVKISFADDFQGHGAVADRRRTLCK